MSSGRNRDYRKLYRANPRNTWQPYPPSRPQFVLQRNRRIEEDDYLYPETRLIDSPSKVHNSRVEFEHVRSSLVNHKKYEGKAKIIILRPDEYDNSSQAARMPSRSSEGSSSTALPIPGPKVNGISKAEQSRLSTEEDPDGPPTPKISLFPESKIVLGWKKAVPVGAGMSNLGNTCYLNSTLQALFYIPSFCNWLLSESDHNETNGCEDLDDNGEKCIICAMSATLKIAQAKSGNVIKPLIIYSRLKSICKHMSHGRQEDAHEFLRYLLEKMEQSYLERFKAKQLDNASKETTPLHRIFGGYMRTEICCGMCKGTSTTFQHFQDLLLDIRRSSSLEDALRVFFSRESLEGDDGGGGGDGGGDAYKCSKCQRKGHCIKRNFIQTPPRVLCIQLKRFTAMGGKLVKPVTYPEKIDIAPYMYNKQHGPINSSPCSQRRAPLMYHLTSVVSHCGASMNSGHYTATAKSPGGAYFEFDDAMVHQVSLHSALGMSAYILMYEMIPSSDEGAQTCTPLKSTSSVFPSSLESSPSIEKQRTFAMPSNRPKLIFGSSPRPVNGVSVPVTSSSPPTPSVPSNSTALPPAKEREKVFFGIKSANQTTSNGFSSASQPSRLNGACISRGLSETNGTSVKKPSPDPKFQHSVSRTSPKVNGVNGSPAKINRNSQHSNSTWNSSATKSSGSAIFPFSLMECNRVNHSGMPPAVMRSLVSRNGSVHSDSNSREVAEKSLNRLSKLGVLVGVSGKGRDGESSSGKADHLVPYPVLSGESSDEEDERRGKRSRKSSENGLAKPLAPASEMTISGNLTADATAIATMRGWTVTGNTISRNIRDSQKTIEGRDTDVCHSRKELPKDKVEVSISSVRERTGEGSSASCVVGEGKKLRLSEEGDRRERVDVGMHTINGEHSEERQSGSSRPSSPCSSTSSQSSDSCSHVSPSIKSILKILERSTCNIMEEAERKDSAESPSKCKVLANGTGSAVSGEGDLEQRSRGGVGGDREGNPLVGKGSGEGLYLHPNLGNGITHTHKKHNSSPLNALEGRLSLESMVGKWLNDSDFKAENCDYSRVENYPLTSTPFHYNDQVNFDGVLSRVNTIEVPSIKNKRNLAVLNVDSNWIERDRDEMNSLLDLPFSKRQGRMSVSKTGRCIPLNLDNLFFDDDQSSSESDDIYNPNEVDRENVCSDSSSSGDVLIENMEHIKEAGKDQTTQGREGESNFSWSSISSDWGKVPQSSGAPPVAVLARSDSRSLISNPS